MLFRRANFGIHTYFGIRTLKEGRVLVLVDGPSPTQKLASPALFATETALEGGREERPSPRRPTHILCLEIHAGLLGLRTGGRRARLPMPGDAVECCLSTGTHPRPDNLPSEQIRVV